MGQFPFPFHHSHSQFDVGLVYDEPGHAIIHKWLLLTDPEDVTSEAKVGACDMHVMC